MRRLILMRHAKSSWSDPRQDDFDRPLNDRGRRGASAVGAWLAREGFTPDLALVSAAVRTRETWDHLGPPVNAAPVRFERALYHADPATMLRILSGAGDVVTALMLGHQPGIGTMAERLLHDAAAHPAYARYPTAATAVIEFDIDDWTDVGWRQGRLAAFATPAGLATGPDED